MQGATVRSCSSWGRKEDTSIQFLLWKQGKCAGQGSVRPVIKKTTETQSDNLKDLKHLKWSAVSVDAALLDAEQQT